jgi:hypothetical protein
MGVWSDEIEGSLSETKPKGVILKAWKELRGFGGCRGVVWRSLVGWGHPGVLLGAQMRPMSSGIAWPTSDPLPWL